MKFKRSIKRRALKRDQPWKPTPYINKVRWSQYYIALGNFVYYFANVETMLYLVVKTTANLDWATLRAIIPNARAEGLIHMMRRLIKVFEAYDEDKKYILEGLEHLSKINSVRNSLLHQQLLPPSHLDPFTVSNVHRALVGSKINNYRVSPEVIDQMTEDLDKIWMRLIEWQNVLFALRQKNYSVLPSLHKRVTESAQRPWLYKPVPPSSTYPLDQSKIDLGNQRRPRSFRRTPQQPQQKRKRKDRS